MTLGASNAKTFGAFFVKSKWMSGFAFDEREKPKGGVEPLPYKVQNGTNGLSGTPTPTKDGWRNGTAKLSPTEMHTGCRGVSR